MPVRFSARLQDGDLLYMSFWLIFMGGFMASILWVMIRIERNTR